MSVQTGQGVSNDTAYFFRLTPNNFFGRYECKVHRRLLDTEGSWVATSPFKLNDREWSITIEHHQDGFLGVYLFSENVSCVTLHFTITLLNFIDDTLSKRHGYRNTLFSPADGEGWRNVAEVFSIAEPDSGFLQEDYFTLVVDMRVILQENETHMLQVDGNAAVCTWRLRYIKDMSPLVALTETFVVGDTKWRLEAYPNGCATSSEELCVYLVNRSKQSVCVHFELRAENQYSDEDVAKVFLETISEGMSHGWDGFLSSQAMEDESLGFLQHGWITLVARITLLGDEIEQYEESLDDPLDEGESDNAGGRHSGVSATCTETEDMSM